MQKKKYDTYTVGRKEGKKGERSAGRELTDFTVAALASGLDPEKRRNPGMAQDRWDKPGKKE